MKVVVTALIKSLKPISHVCLIALLNYFIFGIIGIQLFKGRFGKCENYDNPDNITIQTKDDCKALGGDWVNPECGYFDNIMYSIFTLFQVSTLEEWPKVLYGMVDASEHENHSHR
eukprot:UN31710